MGAELWLKMRPDATDRCDGCGAQAYVICRAYGTLMRWCGHHWAVGETKLIPEVTELHDYRFLLESA